MASLTDLTQMDGVVAAGEWAADGSLVDYEANMDMPPEMAEMSAEFCATVSMMFSTLSGAFTQLTPMQWTPPQGWAFSGGDMTVAVGGRVGVFIKTEQADFNELFGKLVG